MTGDKLACRGRTRMRWAVAGVLFAGCAVAIARPGSEVRYEEDPVRALAASRMQEGLEDMARGRWAEAREKLQVAAQLSSDDPEVAQALHTAEIEVRCAAAVDAAGAALARRDFAHARAALAEVPATSALAAATASAWRDLRSAMDRAVAAAKASLEAGDVRGAAALLEPVKLADASWPSAAALADRLRPRPAPHRARRFAKTARADRAPHRAAVPDPVAREAYLAGYFAKDDDAEAAREAFRKVLAALPPDDETARKAKHWLDKLEGNRTKER